MTDNRTNEPSHNRITIRAFRDGEVSIIHEDQVLGLACTLDELKRAVATYEARGALEAADRPAGTFTEAQVEAAAEAIHNLMQGDPSFKDSGRKREMRIYARAALVAAQGAAPQAESEDNVTCRCGHGTGSHDFSDPQEPCREIVCDCRGWFGVSPVLPSSGVDEDARSLSAWPTVDEVRETFKKSADRLAFDRMIAEVERAAAEKALTEAANELSLMDDGGKRGLAGHSKSSASAITHRHAVAVIRARAEAYTEVKLT